MSAIEVEGLCRRFAVGRSEVTALDRVDLVVPRGQVVGLLGANGAGKTTLIKILSTLLLPSAGRARVAGYDVVSGARQVRRSVAVVYGGDRGFYGRLSGRQNLRFFGMLQGLSRRELAERTEAALDDVGLAAVAGRRVETYSRGMRQRLHIAVGLVASPELLLLDEPSIGLDPVEAHRLRRVIAGMRDGGVTTLITTHQLLDIEGLADRVVMLHEGRIVHDLSVDEFRRQSSFAATVEVTGRGQPPVPGRDAGGLAIAEVTADGELWTAHVLVPAWGPSVFGWLSQWLSPDCVIDLKVEAPRLEDVYRELAGKL